MKAIRYKPGIKEFVLEDVPTPKIVNPEDVLIEVHYAGLCGTDIHIVKEVFDSCLIKAVTLGHEFSGIVLETGSKAQQYLEVGTRVAVDPNGGCNNCKVCFEGKYHYCRGNQPVGVKRDGGFTSLCVVNMKQVHVLPENLTLAQGALCEPLSCVLHGWNRLLKTEALQPNANILILGAGIIGNLWMNLLNHHGFKNVTASDPNAGRRKNADEMGFGYKVVSPVELSEIMPTGRTDAEDEGVDVIIECSGHPPALESSLEWVKKGATILIFGCSPIGKHIKISPEEIFSKELTILGTKINPFTFSRATQLAANMNLDIENLAVGLYKLQNYKQGFEALQKGDISKIMFDIRNSTL